jgi:hypothetical protein
LPTHRLDLLEVYALEHSDIRLIPDEADFVVAFVVDDIREAMAEMQTAGLELVNEPVWAAEAFNDPTLTASPGSGYARPTVASMPSSKSRTDDRREPRRLAGRLSQLSGLYPPASSWTRTSRRPCGSAAGRLPTGGRRRGRCT